MTRVLEVRGALRLSRVRELNEKKQFATNLVVGNELVPLERIPEKKLSQQAKEMK